MNNNYLAHHGVQGQKWGVQNGPPYPLGRTVYSELNEWSSNKTLNAALKYGRTIKKGTESYRMATSDDKIDSKRKYVTTAEDFEGKYKYDDYITSIGMTSQDIHDRGVSQYVYKTTKNLKVAGLNQLTQLYSDMKIKDLKDYNSLINDGIKAITNWTADDKRMLEELKTLDANTKITDIAKKYDAEERNDTLNGRLVREFAKDVLYRNGDATFDALKKKGYDAVTDVEDYNFSKSSIILLNPEKSIKQIGREEIFKPGQY